MNFWGSSKALRRLSDVICLENGLSVIENPKRSRKSYNNWLGDNKLTDRQKLEQIIDKVLAENPTSFDAFIKLLEPEKCEFKHSRRSIRLEGKKGFLRLNSLSEKYTEDAIRERISGKRSVPNKQIAPQIPEKKFSLIIDVQNSIKAQNSPSYEHWAKIHNLKQAAKTLIFLQENNLDDLEVLDGAAQKAKDDYNGTLSAERKKLYSGQGVVRTYMQEFLMARQNVRQLLNYHGDITNQKNINRGGR